MKPLPFELNHCRIRRGVQGLAFVQITLEKCRTNFYFENRKSGIDCQSAALINIKHFRIFMEPWSHGTLLVILLASAVICKQKSLHGHKILQYFQHFKCYNTGQEHLRKPF